MKLNRILSSLLVIVLLVTGILAAFPVGASAEEETPAVSVKPEAELSEDEVKKIVQAYKEAKFQSAEELLASDFDNGYLDSITYKGYSLYVNRYTGFIYYVNNLTGQILTSNPIDPGFSPKISPSVLSTIELNYVTHAAPDKDEYEYSISCIEDGSLISVSATENGIKVDYVLGEAASIYLVPGAIMMDDLEEHIIKPLFANFAAVIDTYLDLPEGGFTHKDYTFTSFDGYISNKNDMLYDGDFYSAYIVKVINALVDYAGTKLDKKSSGYSAISDFSYWAKQIFDQKQYKVYSTKIISDEAVHNLWYEIVPEMKTSGLGAFVIDNTLSNDQIETIYGLLGKAIKYCIPSMTREIAQEIEDRTGYRNILTSIPSFECSLVYSINDDGTLEVDFPANSIKYEEDVFILKSITPLRYFGSGDMTNDGYAFFPDGSGTVIEFDDFYSEKNALSVRVNAEMYGKDYCYATITGKHKEQVTMPVYGLVNEVKANSATKALTGMDTVTNGFFAILEEGSSLAKLAVYSGGGFDHYAATYASYTPYSYDQYKLGDAISVGGDKSYLVVSETPYTGSYKTRYTMLIDPVVSAAVPSMGGYSTSYVGMAACYKQYLKDNGVLTKLNTESTALPLYIETLGAMDVLTRILTFPVSVSSPLTTFEDVETMYSELYAKGITNINFKLTGFANGGMYFTYPARVKWEKSLGGKKGFNHLIDAAAVYSADTDPNTNFGIFPDFDFQYISNTAIFDRVGNSRHAAKMVDNRYASKQVYNSITSVYDSIFSIVVSSNVLDGLYTKFQKQYSKYNISTLSVSTLGSDLNSNFDDDNSISREQARQDVDKLLDRMANSNGYTLMTDIGNMYSLKYVDHILNATIDSSHFTFSSYPVPFYGMVLHGYVNYAGSPINYTGSVDYNILHSIENGASLYYILCMQNANYLKEDEMLSKYYGVDYKNWKDKIVAQYERLNAAIGSYQNYEIVDHSAIIGERIMNSKDAAENNFKLIIEYIENVDKLVSDLADATFDQMIEDPNNIGKGIHITIDTASLKADACERINLTAEELDKFDFDTLLNAVVVKYAAEYPEKAGAVEITFDKSQMQYTSVYDFVTDSVANAENYDYTDFTCDNGSIVIVTYKDTAAGDNGKTVLFILNYNNYPVKVRLDNTIDKTLEAVREETIKPLDFVKIEIN